MDTHGWNNRKWILTALVTTLLFSGCQSTMNGAAHPFTTLFAKKVDADLFDEYAAVPVSLSSAQDSDQSPSWLEPHGSLIRKTNSRQTTEIDLGIDVR